MIVKNIYSNKFRTKTASGCEIASAETISKPSREQAEDIQATPN